MECANHCSVSSGTAARAPLKEATQMSNNMDQTSAPAGGEALAAQGIARLSEAPQDRWADRHGDS